MLTPAQNAALEGILPLINGFIDPPAPPPRIFQAPMSNSYPSRHTKPSYFSIPEKHRKRVAEEALEQAVAAVDITTEIILPTQPASPAVTFVHDHSGVIMPLEIALSKCLIDSEAGLRAHLIDYAPHKGHCPALSNMLAYGGIGNLKGDRKFNLSSGTQHGSLEVDADTGVCWLGHPQTKLDPEAFAELHGALAAGEVVADDGGRVEGLEVEASASLIQDLWDAMISKESRFAVLSNGRQLVIFERTATNVLSMTDIIGNEPSTVNNIVVGEFPVMFALTTLEPSLYLLPGHGHPSDPPLSPNVLPTSMIGPILWPTGPITVTAVPSVYNRFLPISDKTFLFSKSVSSTHDDTLTTGTPSTTSTLIPTGVGLTPHKIHLSDLVGQGSVCDVYTVDFASISKDGRPPLIAKICRPSVFPELEDGSGDFTRPVAESSIAVELRAYTTELQAILPGVVPVFYGCYSMEMDGDLVYMMIMENVGPSVAEESVGLSTKRDQYQVLYQYGKLHQAGTVHNDVHPRNWCLSSEDMASFRIIDFGQCVSRTDKDEEGKVVDLEQLAGQEMSYVRGWLSKTLRSWEFEKKKNMVWETPREGKWQVGLDPERKIPERSERPVSFAEGSGWELPC